MQVLNEQLQYYRARAAEYDEWFLRLGRYDRGPDTNQRWFDEIEIVRGALETFRPVGDVLEIACGTGNWTERLAPHADTVLAVDGAPEMLAINQARTSSLGVRHQQANIFEWTPDQKFDCVFFGFWLSHVPEEKFEPFWETVELSLKPGGRVFFVDSLPDPDSQAKNHPPVDAAAGLQKRVLNDGQQYEIVKRYYQPESLTATLAQRGWKPEITTSGTFFLYGSASRVD